MTQRQLVLSVVEDQLRVQGSGLEGERPRDVAGDGQKLENWTAAYRAALERADSESQLLELGRELYQWLEGGSRWLSRAIEEARPSWVVEFRGSRRPSPLEKQFLSVPWELLADGQGYLAGRYDLRYCPVRRLGEPGRELKPSPFRLSLLFMAAAPQGLRQLDYEGEEAAILQATETLGIDLAVEESGNLELLGARVAREAAREALDVLHLSCHGQVDGRPYLALEDEEGGLARVTGQQLDQQVAEQRPRLLFLSACQTAQADELLGSLSQEMVRYGLPAAVLGWGGSVRDTEATRFAASLYRCLAQHNSLPDAVARARGELLDPQGGSPPSRDWHLARLLLGPEGGGPLCEGTATRQRRNTAYKEFLDEVKKEVPVAGRDEFVGRRREIQTVLREFRQQSSAGVLIHGMGRQGKSSLAARVAHRLPDHQLVVLYKHYDAQALLDALERVIDRQLVAALQEARQQPEQLYYHLKELLEGPFGQLAPEGGGRPLLLVLDDFEQALDPPAGEGLHTVKPHLVEVVRSVIRAFADADSDSQLLLTSRYRFTLPEGSRDLAERLYALQLPPMQEYEGKKQARAKLRATAAEEAPPPAALTERLVQVARGNSGLQDLLFSLAVGSEEACRRALDAMQAYRQTGQAPDEQQLEEFLKDLALEELLKLLTPEERQLLEASTLFELPVPRETLEQLGRALALDAGDPCGVRLLALGLWEVFAGLVDPQQAAVAVNALVVPRVEPLSPEAEQQLAGLVSGDLLQRWGGVEGGRRRPYAADVELARLALLAGDHEVLRATATDAVRGLAAQFEYRRAAEVGCQAVAMLESAGQQPPPQLLRVTAEQCGRTGDVATARGYLRRCTEAYETAQAQGETVDAEDQAAALLTQGRQQAQDGEPEAALALFRRAEGLLAGETHRRERAIALGDIARILTDQGQVDEALQMHQEKLEVVEQLGTGGSRAVTLGDIARILTAKGQVDEALQMHQELLTIYKDLGAERDRAIALGDIARILRAKGQVDEALQMHQEMVGIFEQLGDRRSRAVTLGDIARILTAKGQVDEALQMHQEMVGIFEQLGDRRSRAVTLGDIARILTDQGQVDEALQMHQELLTIYKDLGAERERAIALGDIARILRAKGQVDEALQMHQEMVGIFEQLGDRPSRAVTLGDIARILTDQGQVDEALQMHQERLAVYEQLGDRRSRAVTLGDIARILRAKGQVDEALQMHQQELEVYEQLGDRRSRAVTLGDIARILTDQGQVDEALQMHQEQIEVYEQLGDRRSRAVTLGDIARILTAKGQVDEALQMHQEMVGIFEQLGDRRSRAVTLGDIARILTDQGQVDEALQMHQEQIEVYEQLGDQDGIAHVSWSLGEIAIQKKDWPAALENLSKSYAINLKLGRLDGICFVGLSLGQLLCRVGQTEEGLAMLNRSRDGFTRLGRTEQAAQLEQLIQQIQAQQDESESD